MRILVTVTPRLYREAIALSIYKHRPLHEVRLTGPEITEEEIRRFRPDLLVRTDNDGLDPEVLARVFSYVEVLYTDSMATRIVLDGRTDVVPDASMDDLLAAIDEAEELIPAGCG